MSIPWKKKSEAQKARCREDSRRYRMSAKGKAAALARKRRWNDKNRERKRASAREWYARHKDDAEWMADRYSIRKEWTERNRERIAAKAKEWRKAHPLYGREYQRIWKMQNRERVREMQRAYAAKNREKLLQYDKARRAKMRLVFARDAAAYAKHRALDRNRRAKRVEKTGRVYVPRPSMRIPDYVPFGVSSALAARSVFVWENHGEERQRELSGFARDLYIERKEWRDAK